MAQYEIQLKDLIRIVRKRRNIIVFSTVSLAILSFMFALIQSPSPLYRATAKVKYDKSQTLTGMMPSSFYFSPYSNIKSQTKVITSFPVVKEAAKEVGIIDKNIDEEEILNSQELMRRISTIEAAIVTEPEENTNIIRITVTYNDPEMAANIANALAESYKKYNKELLNKRTIETKKFIEKQLEELDARLKDAEDKLKDFQNKKEIVSLDSQAMFDLKALGELELSYKELGRENQMLVFLKKRLGSGNLSGHSDKLGIHSTLYKYIMELQSLLIERDRYLTTYTARHPKVKEVNNKITILKKSIRLDISERIDTNKKDMETLNKDIEIYKEITSQYPNDNLTLIRLEREVELQSRLFSELNSTYQEILIQESGMIEEVSKVAPALVNKSRINPPKLASSFFMGLIIGLFLGVFFAIVSENLDTSIGTIEDVESYLKVPVLGVIPYITSIMDEEKEDKLKEKEMEAPLVFLMNPKSQIVEAYRSLRTNILFLNQEKGMKTFMITSSSLQEGKTINCINVAVTLAQGGYRTLLVEADLRRGTISKNFGLDKSPGLMDIILANEDWKGVVRNINDILLGSFDMDVLIKSPELSNFNIITSGAFPINPSELISSQQMSNFIDEVKESYDFVIFDTTPVLPVTDAVLLSQKLDGVILLYEVGKIARGVLRRTKSHLDAVKANVIGVILNGVTPEYGPDYYEYHYQYYYGEGTKKGLKTSELEKIKEMFKRENLKHLLVSAKEGIVNLFKNLFKKKSTK
jgi:polysaccharide biosynthesis transport protein